MDEQKDTNYPPEIDIRKCIEILAKQKGFILVFFLSATLFSLGLTYFVSEKYQAVTTIFYRPVGASLLRHKETESFGAPVPSAPFKVISQTLRDAVRNEAVLRPVVEKLNLDQEIKAEYHTWYERLYHKTKNYVKCRLLDTWQLLKYGRLIEEDPRVAAIKRLRKNIDIVATRDSYIHILKVRDKHPQRAAKIVDLASRQMVEWLNQQHQGDVEQRVHQLAQGVKSKEDAIATLQELRKNILEENDLVSITEETTRALANLYHLGLEDIRISAQIRKKEAEVAGYDRDAREKSSSYIQSEDIKSLRSAKLFGEIELQGLKAERQLLNSSLKALKERLGKLPSLQKRLDMLDMNIASAIREHEHLKDLYTESSAQVTPVQSETRVLHTAVVPSAPVQPIKVYHVALTALLALFVAVGAAYLLDYLNLDPSDSFRKAAGRRKTATSLKLAGASDKLEQASKALREFARELSGQGGSLFLRKADSMVLVQSLDPGHTPATIPLPIRKGSVFEQVMSTGQPALIEDIEHKAGVLSSGWKGYKDSSALAFPLSSKTGETVGLVSVHNKFKGPFTQQDKERGLAVLASKLSHLIPSAEQVATDAVQRAVDQAEGAASVGLGQKVFHLDKDKELAAELLNSQLSGRAVRHRLHPIIRYPLIIVCGVILAGLVFYFLLKIGH